jgi:hypothetical protein
MIMTTNALKQNENLCNKLEMNFDEANELFGKETLNSMQMVKVNGGILSLPPINPIVPIILQVVQIIIGAASVFQDNDNPCGSEFEFSVEPSGKVKAKGKNVSFTADSVVTAKTKEGTSVTIHGPKIEPSSSGNSGGSGN